MSDRKDIQDVVNNALCAACGACCGVCPAKAIQMKWNASGYLIAKVDQTKCTLCGLCRAVCPSVAANRIIVDGCDPFHGFCLNAYIGHSMDAEIRQKSQSGGIVTSLLCYLLEQREIEGALVNRFCEETQRPEVVCVATREELLVAAGSYYSQSAVTKAIVDNQDKKCAAVVLGCQAESLKLIREVCPRIALPAYTIGLICAGQYSGKLIDDLISLAGAGRQKVHNFRFRDKEAGGWPGNVKVYASDQDYVLDKTCRHRLKHVYEVPRCLFCFDQMNVHSDLVVGDPWGINDPGNAKGNSVIIARTPKGQCLIDSAVKRGYIKVSQLHVEDVIKGQTVDDRLKTQFFTAIDVCRNKGCPSSVNAGDLENSTFVEPTHSQWREINERFEYTRKVYLEEDSQTINRIVAIKKEEMTRRLEMARLMNLPKTAVKRVLRLCVSLVLKMFQIRPSCSGG